MAAGIVVVMSLLTDLALSSAPVDRAGSASSLLETGTEFGGALGMAALGSIGTAVYRHAMPDTAPEPAQETLGGALAVAAELPGRAGDALAAAARAAFTDGMRGAAIAGALLLLVAAGVAVVGPAAHPGASGDGERRTGRGTQPVRRVSPTKDDERWGQTRFTERAEVAPISAASSPSTEVATVSSTVSTASASPPTVARATCMLKRC